MLRIASLGARGAASLTGNQEGDQANFVRSFSMEWGSTLIGALIVVLTTQIKDFFEHRRSMQKEAEQWERQKEAEESRRKRDEAITERQLARDVYRKCISLLSLISVKGDELEIPQEEKLKLYKETLEWLSLLEMHSNGLDRDERHNLYNTIRDFTVSPASFAEFLLEAVKKMAMTDRILAPDRPEPKKKNPNERRVQVDLDESFRRMKAIEGKELRKTYMFDCDISTLTPSQREKLWDMHYARNGGIPLTIYLSTPAFDEGTKEVILKGSGIWKAKLDPTACSAQARFNAWEVAFEEALELAEKAKTQSRKNDPTALVSFPVSPAGDP